MNDLLKLVKWAQVLGAPQGVLWFSLPLADVQSVNDLKDTGPEPDITVDDRFVLSLERPARSGVGLDNASRRAIPGRSRLVSAEDVHVIREATQAFRQIDNRFGGGHARSAVSIYLSMEIGEALSEGRFAKGTRPHFERAAAEMYQLAGWMAYDVGDEREGKRNLRQALELATAADDDALTAEMLAAMSHQAAFLKRADEAIDLALAARRAAHRSGAPALQAESAALEAQGLALAQDARGCIAALRRAEHAFLAATGDNTPQWLLYFDKAYLSAKFAQALHDLGRPVDAERFARDSLQMSDGYERGRLFNTALLASILADAGKIDESVVVARQAVQMAGKVRSVRAQSYLRDAGTRLLPYASSADVRALHREISAAGVNLPR